MRIVTVSGGHRSSGQTGRVAHYLAQRVRQMSNANSRVLDLSLEPMPLWDERAWDDSQQWPETWGAISQELNAADCFIFVTPELGGMASPAIKNFFLFCKNDELAHKPGLIVAVSASQGGAYPVAELRMSSYKNTRVCHIPEHIIVRRVEEMLEGERPTSEEDLRLRNRIDYALQMLVSYADALRAMRASGLLSAEIYPYGM